MAERRYILDLAAHGLSPATMDLMEEQEICIDQGTLAEESLLEDPATRQHVELVASGISNRCKYAILDFTALDAAHDLCLEPEWTDRFDGPAYPEQDSDDGDLETDSEEETLRESIFVECRLGYQLKLLVVPEGISLGDLVLKALNEWQLHRDDLYALVNGRYRPDEHLVQNNDKVTL